MYDAFLKFQVALVLLMINPMLNLDGPIDAAELFAGKQAITIALQAMDLVKPMLSIKNSIGGYKCVSANNSPFSNSLASPITHFWARRRPGFVLIAAQSCPEATICVPGVIALKILSRACFETTMNVMGCRVIQALDVSYV